MGGGGGRLARVIAPLARYMLGSHHKIASSVLSIFIGFPILQSIDLSVPPSTMRVHTNIGWRQRGWNSSSSYEVSRDPLLSHPCWMFLRHILLVKFQCSVALQDVVCTMCSKTESNGEEVRVVQDFGGVLKGDFCVAFILKWKSIHPVLRLAGKANYQMISETYCKMRFPPKEPPANCFSSPVAKSIISYVD